MSFLSLWSRVRARRDSLAVVAVLGLLLVLYFLPSPYLSPYAHSVQRARGRVLETDNHLIRQFGIMKTGTQLLQVQVLDGPYAGQKVPAVNDLIGKMETDKMFAAGDTAFLVLDVEADRVISATAYDHYRLNTEALLFALFALLLIGFAGWTGLRALLSFVFAAALIWKVLLPAILLRWDPVLVALAVVTLLTAVTMLMVAGWTKTALVAFVGSLLGVLVTCLLSFLLFPPFRLHGAIQPFSETLLYSGHVDLNLTRLFLAAIFLGASGAVMDLAIDVAAAMNEVIAKRPDLSRRAAIESGLAVGRAMTGTMITTLLMAYAAGYMALLMVFMSQGTPPINILNTNYVAAEILRTLVGSFGLVTVAPFTALVGGLILTSRQSHQLLPVTATVQSESEVA